MRAAVKRTNRIVLFLGLAVTFVSCFGQPLRAAGFKRTSSPTSGIQEAINALPAGGGEVYVPAGTYVLKAPVRLRDNVTLRGAGAATILKKDKGFSIPLAEDAKVGQNHVIVTDSTGLEPGMVVVVADDKGIAKSGRITKLEGNRVHLNKSLAINASTKQNARLVNAHAMIWVMCRNVIIEKLTIDGNKAEQPRDARRGWIGGGIKGFLTQSRIRHCWIHNTASDGMYISQAEGGTIITGCEIHHCGNIGIHMGPGVGTVITANEIHHNESAGTHFCTGNTSDVIANNVVYNNGGAGIGGMSGDSARKVKEDKYQVIKGNIAFNNGRSGISVTGGRDAVITGNICYNNCQDPALIGRAGIFVVNGHGYVVSGNRCFDDQASYRTSTLAADAAAGQNTIKIKERANLVFFVGQRIVISDNTGQEQHELVKVTKSSVHTKEVLARAYEIANSAQVSGMSTQGWGILEGGAAHDNIITGNDCRGNMYGGITYCGPRTISDTNLGEIKSAVVKPEDLPSIPAVKTTAPPVIDGDLSDACWQKAGVAKDFRNSYSQQAAQYHTEVRLLRDADYLYICYKCDEPELDKLNPKATARDRGGAYLDDCVELFLGDDSQPREYCQLIFNSAGAVDDRMFTVPDEGKKKRNTAWPGDYPIAAGKGKGYWTLEFALPLEALAPDGSMPRQGWRINFNRTRRIKKETSCWAPTFASSHNRGNWGYLRCD